MLQESTSSVLNIGMLPEISRDLKFLIVGAIGVGKTSIVNRFFDDKFFTTHKTTIGVDFYKKSLYNTANNVLHIQVWDVAGEDKFRCIPPVYYRGASGIALVFDLTKPDTLDIAQRWLEEIRNNVSNEDGSPLPVMLLANKNDMKNKVSVETIVKFCEDNQIDCWCMTSAKRNENIEKSFAFLIQQSLKVSKANEDSRDYKKDSIIKLSSSKKKERKSCCT